VCIVIMIGRGTQRGETEPEPPRWSLTIGADLISPRLPRSKRDFVSRFFLPRNTIVPLK
jgi:hypothetical protein